MGAMANESTAAAYVDWEEVVVSSNKGRREVHYYLKRRGGGKDLVVVGKEKSVRHMTYRYDIKDKNLLHSILNGSPRLKLRSRREVIDWLNSILKNKSISKSWLRALEFSLPILGDQQHNSCRQFGDGIERNLDDHIIEDAMMHKSGQYRAEFTWLGSSWTCRRRRMHYQSFCRNGAVISVHEFVYVLAEKGNRLVAYLDDLYEDTRGNKMVVVRWFHKIDEVGIVLPHNYNDREIFFSLCLQDLSIECIDGLATVLSPEHYEKFSNEATHRRLMPFVCCKLFDNDYVKPYDITRIKGYWKQEIFRTESPLHELSGDDFKSKGCTGEAVGIRTKKRIRWSKESDLFLKSPDEGLKKGFLREDCSYPSLGGQENVMPPNCGQYLAISSQVEVLSQDSGIRGCWFRALIIKKHKDKVKVQYMDLKDAVDDTKHLEEWILVSRLAAPDALGIRLSGRTIVRPNPSSEKGVVSGVVKVGSVVDAWWHDGWWEGIIVKKESEDRLIVYFPEEKQDHVFCSGDLRHSKEWVDNGWRNINQRPDVITSFYGPKHNSSYIIKQDALPSDDGALDAPLNNYPLPQLASNVGNSTLHSDDKMPKESRAYRDLLKDDFLAGLRWKSSGKRRRSRSPVYKAQFGTHSSSVKTGLPTFNKLSSPLKLDVENCKYANDSHFNSAVVRPLTNLVMSR